MPADDLAEEAYRRPARCASKAAKKVGVGQLAMRGQEYVVALKPCGRGMLLETLRYADEVNKAAGYLPRHRRPKPDPDLLDMASTLIEQKSRRVRPERIPQPLRRRAAGLIEEKQKEKGEKVIEDPDADAPPPRAPTSST